MAETLITRTFAEGLQPLGAAAQRNHALITDRVAARFSSRHALLFCEPVTTRDGVATDWYAGTTGTVRRLDDLGDDEAGPAQQRLGELVADIVALANECEAAGDGRLAEALRNAVEVPASDAVWLIGDQPILVTWAHSRDVDKAPRGVLRRFLPPVPPPPPEPAARRIREPVTARDVLWWLGWLVLGVLVFWGFWLLVQPCGLRLPGMPNLDMCPPSLASVIEVEKDRRASLADRVARLERDLAATCAPWRPRDVIEDVLAEGGAVGAVNVILSWEGPTDLDLHIHCPSGARVGLGMQVACGAHWDVDHIGAPAGRSQVENTVFADMPAPGKYRVRVHNFDGEGGTDIPFTLSIIIDGDETVHSGTSAGHHDEWWTEFEIGGT